MKTLPKVGDWVVSLVTEFDVRKGYPYKVMDAPGDTLYVRDDKGDRWPLHSEEYMTSVNSEIEEPPSDTYQVSVPVPRGMRLKTVTYAFIDD